MLGLLLCSALLVWYFVEKCKHPDSNLKVTEQENQKQVLVETQNVAADPTIIASNAIRQIEVKNAEVRISSFALH
jgi:hypothetical protein